MKYSKTVLFSFFLLLSLYGCASPAIRTGYLLDYDRLYKGKHLENYWANKSLINESKYSTIRIEPINIDRILAQKGVTPDDCRRCVYDALRKEGEGSLQPHFVFDEQPDIAQVKLEIAITEMTPGSAVGRIFAGELGLGHAWIQVEGKVVDLKRIEEIAAFSDRRRSSGAIGLRDLGKDSGPILVCELLKQIAADIIYELKESFSFRK